MEHKVKIQFDNGELEFDAISFKFDVAGVETAVKKVNRLRKHLLKARDIIRSLEDFSNAMITDEDISNTVKVIVKVGSIDETD